MNLYYLVGFLTLVSAFETTQDAAATTQEPAILAEPLGYRRYYNQSAPTLICSSPQCTKGQSGRGGDQKGSMTSTLTHYITKTVACPDCKVPETITQTGQSGQVIIISIPTDTIQDTFTSVNPSSAPISSIIIPGQTAAAAAEYEGMGTMGVVSVALLLLSLVTNML